MLLNRLLKANRLKEMTEVSKCVQMSKNRCRELLWEIICWYNVKITVIHNLLRQIVSLDIKERDKFCCSMSSPKWSENILDFSHLLYNFFTVWLEPCCGKPCLYPVWGKMIHPDVTTVKSCEKNNKSDMWLKKENRMRLPDSEEPPLFRKACEYASEQRAM